MSNQAGEMAGGAVAEETALGVVIQVPAPLDDSLRAWRRRYGGERSARIAPHITLVSGSTTDWDAALRHVHTVAAHASAFTVRLRGTGSFRPINPVVFLNVEEGAQACAQLHDALLAGPLHHDVTYGYRPHLTIAHEADEVSMDLAQEELKGESMDFTVDSIGIFGIDSTGAWSLHEELDLGGASS